MKENKGFKSVKMIMREVRRWRGHWDREKEQDQWIDYRSWWVLRIVAAGLLEGVIWKNRESLTVGCLQLRKACSYFSESLKWVARVSGIQVDERRGVQGTKKLGCWKYQIDTDITTS